MYIKSKDNETNMVEVDAYIPLAKLGVYTLFYKYEYIKRVISCKNRGYA